MSSTPSKYPNLFSPIKIGPVELKNRFFIPPHGLHTMTVGGPHGSLIPSTDWAHYLEERASAGVGLLYLPMTTFPRIRGASALFEEAIPSYRAVAEGVHRHGAKIFGQVHLREGGVPWEPLGAVMPLLTPSDEQNYGSHATGSQMTAEFIGLWLEAQGQMARHLTAAGFDGIELHVSHGMVIEMFLSPYFNKRKDEYGGSLEGRMRVLVDSLRAVRLNMSDRMALGIRLNCDQLLTGGLTQDDAREILVRLADLELIEFADLDIAVEPHQGELMVANQFMAPLHVVPFSGSVGAAVQGRIVRLGTGGRLTTAAQAERLLADGVLDVVGAVRELLAEPEMIKNAMEGREDQSRTCIACNFCLSGGPGGRVGFGCVINPATGREGRWGVKTFVTSASRSKVVVAGGGPAGMEAARVAAKLGHEVVLLERREKVGGQLNHWSVLPGRDILVTTVSWCRRQLEQLGVRVLTGIDATEERILAERPDAVILATGSHYVPTGESAFVPAAIPGSDRSFVYTPEQILEEGARPTGRVLLLDEERIHTGVGIAEMLAMNGADVEVVTRDLELVGPALKNSHEYPTLIPRLMGLGVRITIATYLKEIRERTATVYHVLTKQEEERPVDAVVLATMRRAEGSLARALKGKVAQLFVIGDAMAPRYLFEATYEGQRFARLVGVEGAPRNMIEAMAVFTPPPAEVFPRSAATLLEPVGA